MTRGDRQESGRFPSDRALSCDLRQGMVSRGWAARIGVLPRVYVRDFAGLANRIESLAVAYAIREAGGHRLVLDWPELDALEVRDAEPGQPLWWRVPICRTCPRLDTDADVTQIARATSIEVRRFYGNAPAIARHHALLRDRILVREDIAASIVDSFTHHAQGRPVVGLHIRRGDFRASGNAHFDPNGHRHAAVPSWWFRDMMSSIRAQIPGVRFLASVNGSLAEFGDIVDAEGVFTIGCRDSRARTRRGHEAAVHPVADLFALACCSAVLATPGSSFSHVAVNSLGVGAVAIVPALGARPGEPRFATVRAHGMSLNDWNVLSRNAICAGSSLDFEVTGPGVDWLRAGR